MRIKIFRLIIFALFILLVNELFFMQVIRGNFYYKLSLNNRIRVVPLNSYRGRILDRNETVLADNRFAYNILVVPQDVEDEDKLFQFLSKTLDISVKELARRYENRRFAPFAPVMIAEDIAEEKIIVIEENRYRFPSIFVEETYRRLYPHPEENAHVLGYVGKINQAKLEALEEYGFTPDSLVGYSGVEEYYDKDLHGEEGGSQIEVNSRGEQVRLLSFKEPKQGDDIHLTIDERLQKRTQDILGAHKGAVVVMDASSGEILTLVSSPTFNPNVFSDSFQNKRVSELFRNPDSPLLNRAVRGVYPPGSVFKVVMAVAGLDLQKIDAHSTFICPGFYELGGIRFGCTHVHDSQDLLDAIAHSCNVYFYHLGLGLGVDSIVKYAKLFGLGEKTFVDLPYEGAGHLPNRFLSRSSVPRRWYGGETLNTSIGQGETLTTPLQLASMMATVVNDGLEVEPHLLLKNGSKENTTSYKKQLGINKQIFETVKIGLRRTVTDPTGTANVLNFSDLYVAGKTGTAQSGKDKENHAWFVGYAKTEEKTVVVSVFLEHGGSSYNACVVTKDILSFMQQEKIL
jgi:penicillin-binding protein 2